jgi:hypothetical protein
MCLAGTGSVEGVWTAGIDSLSSSRSEFRRGIEDGEGSSARVPSPIALEEFGNFLTWPTVSRPAAANLTFAFSLSPRNLSLSLCR